MIKIKVTDTVKAAPFVFELLKLGFVMLRPIVRKKYLFFGQRIYTIRLMPTKKSFINMIDLAIKAENYEEAGRLKFELDKFLRNGEH